MKEPKERFSKLERAFKILEYLKNNNLALGGDDNGVTAQIAVKQTSTQLANVQSVDQHMIQLWQNASKAERQKFMTWLAEQ